MNWISDIFKDITVSKTLTAACFITGVTLLVAPRLFPSMFEALPKVWATGLLGVVVFSGCLLTFWGIQFVKDKIVGFMKVRAQYARSQNLTELELSFIYLLGELADKTADLDNIDYRKAPFSKLELLDVCRSLNEKGLLDINAWNENLVYLSESGRKKALELHKAQALK
ncbi:MULTISPECIES: hypothetical protein [Vibrio]|nr:MULTISPECIES: hypothetical protein [Vibrio]MDW2297987.1 hypothetical protein [Vibrio sp. 1404]AVF74737.1 hypothetical protein AL539_13545 [Vibrio alginolyticus]MBS9953731.1 hypothetical protein [Vibrio alginolyticus]MCA2459096.1 hypothetical protein [Vibrio alginolyticus]MCA2464667.1 hypothetical protein [Vibrio alginolyticus]